MKKLLLVFLILTTLQAVSQENGIIFRHCSFEEAIKQAKQEKKKIFIDFFTEWCGPCLNMALTVFPLPQVGDVYNKNFVCLKIDTEKGEGKELARRYNVHSYPTYIFIDPKTEKIIHRSGGNKPVKDFLFDAQGALNPKLSSVYLNEIYRKGEYDIDFLINYIRMQKTSGNHNLLKDFDRLIAMGGKLTESRIWNLYVECINGYNNPYVKEISDNYNKFCTLFGSEAVDNKLTSATAYAPIEYIRSLCDFNGKYYNLKVGELINLFREDNYDAAWTLVGELIQDPNIDQKKFVEELSFYTRVNPNYKDHELTFEQLAKKIQYTRYVAYNIYNRDEAMVHYYYASALEYLIQRAYKEGKHIPAFIYEMPILGKKEYDMRHPLLKQKSKRKK